MFLTSLGFLSLVTAAVLLCWLYFRRYAMTRPPIGVFNLGDIAIMIGMVILVPFLYLWLPLWVVAGLLALASTGILYFTTEPVLPQPWMIWLATIFLSCADLLAALLPGSPRSWFFAVNNVIIVICVIGVTNLWAQSGMKARHVAILGAALAVYDLVATWVLPLMKDLSIRIETLPFAPQLAWPINAAGDWLGPGLGDLVLVAVFPLVMRKAFGREAGVVAMVLGLGTIGLLIISVVFGFFEIFPVMVILGPLMVLYYAYWRHRQPERTTWQYLQAEPMS